MKRKYNVAGNMSFFLNVVAQDQMQARNEVLKVLDKYKDILNLSVNGMDIVEEK